MPDLVRILLALGDLLRRSVLALRWRVAVGRLLVVKAV